MNPNRVAEIVFGKANDIASKLMKDAYNQMPLKESEYYETDISIRLIPRLGNPSIGITAKSKTKELSVRVWLNSLSIERIVIHAITYDTYLHEDREFVDEQDLLTSLDDSIKIFFTE